MGTSVQTLSPSFAPAIHSGPEIDVLNWYAVQTRARHEKMPEFLGQASSRD